MTELIIALVGFAVLYWVIGRLSLEQLKNKSITPLKNAIKSSERRSKEAAAKELADADVDRVIGFLNSLHEDSTDTD